MILMYELLLDIETLLGGGGFCLKYLFQLDLGFKLVKLYTRWI